MGPAHRLRKAALAVLLLGSAATLALAGNDGAPRADITIRVRVPQGSTPAILTDADQTGLYKLVRIGQSTSAFRLVNPDANVALKIVPDPGVGSNEVTVVLGGTNGPDPLPTLTVAITQCGQPAGIPSIVTLYPGQSTTCTNCDVTMKLSTP